MFLSFLRTFLHMYMPTVLVALISCSRIPTSLFWKDDSIASAVISFSFSEQVQNWGISHQQKWWDNSNHPSIAYHFTIQSLNATHNLTCVSGFSLNIKSWNKEQGFCLKTLGDKLIFSGFWDLCSLAPTHPFSSFWDLCGLVWFSQGVVWPHPSPQSWLHSSNLNVTFFKSEFFFDQGGNDSSERWKEEKERLKNATLEERREVSSFDSWKVDKCNTGGKKRGE